MTHHTIERTNNSCKKLSSKKRCTIFYDKNFLTTCVMKNFFCLFFYSLIFACKKIWSF